MWVEPQSMLMLVPSGSSFIVTDWLQMQQFEWFCEKENHLFALNFDKVNYYLLALQYEPNLKGTVK